MAKIESRSETFLFFIFIFFLLRALQDCQLNVLFCNAMQYCIVHSFSFRLIDGVQTAADYTSLSDPESLS